MWTFAIEQGKIYDPSGAFFCPAYAGGNLGKNPEDVNNPDAEGLANKGPLPEGIYTFGEPIEQGKLGTFAIPLIPDPSNDMKGRSGFYWHGDLIGGGFESGSEGCIVSAPVPRRTAWASSDHKINVVKSFVVGV